MLDKAEISRANLNHIEIFFWRTGGNFADSHNESAQSKPRGGQLATGWILNAVGIAGGRGSARASIYPYRGFGRCAFVAFVGEIDGGPKRKWFRGGYQNLGDGRDAWIYEGGCPSNRMDSPRSAQSAIWGPLARRRPIWVPRKEIRAFRWYFLKIRTFRPLSRFGVPPRSISKAP